MSLHSRLLLLIVMAAPGGWALAEPPGIARVRPKSTTENTRTLKRVASTEPTCAVDIPAGLPRYDLDIELNTFTHEVKIRQRTTWTNNTARPTNVLVFNFYPRYQIPDGDYLLLAKTLELVRLEPNAGIDRKGGHGVVNNIRLVRGGENVADLPAGKPQLKNRLHYSFREDNICAITVELPESVEPGQSVTVDIDCEIRLPNKQGRWGHWRGVTFLTNALPTLAYYDSAGWHDMPFVPWHQPFWNEAAVYTAKIRTSDRVQKVVVPAAIHSLEPWGKSDQVITTKPFVGRDFAILASADFKEHRVDVPMPDGRKVAVTCYAFERHAHFAEKMLEIAAHALKTYSKWFGPYPYDQFAICESYFGWNGNESAGLVMIDERVFDMPDVGRGYIEYLLSHEICHQWWYNLVGTNGYSETFMDEAPATYFTHRMIDRLRGKNNDLMEWPKDLKGIAPRIRRENYRFGSIQSTIRRDTMPAAVGQLPDYGNLFSLFSGAYDRGSKVFGMIEERLGEDAMLDFCQTLVKKYAFRVLSVSAFKEELETYSGRKFDDLFDRWVYGKGLTDWRVENVTIDGHRPGGFLGYRLRDTPKPGPYRIEVVVRQKGEYDEPTTLGFQFVKGDRFPVRIPIGPTSRSDQYPELETRVLPIGDRQLRVSLVLERAPIEVKVDPDDILLDANVGDNTWNRTPRVKLTPLYSTIAENDLTSDYDRWNLSAGPWVWGASYQDPWYTRSTMFGLRAGAYRTQVFQGGIYSALRSDFRDIVLGADALIDHFPFPKTQVGLNFERRIAGPYFASDGSSGANRGYLFGRYVITPGSSMYLPPMHYSEVFASYQDNFLPIAREAVENSQRPNWTQLNGVHHRLNLNTPYWDPTTGFYFDASYAAGVANLDKTVFAQQMRGEIAAARKLPDGYGWASEVRVAGRLAIGAAFPNRGQFFALGGSTQFRGFDLAERQGSFFWLASAETRLPIVRDAKWNVADNAAGLRHLYLAAFYDVGGIYTRGEVVGNVAHSLGTGIRADISIFSFIERATLRFDIAKTVNASSPFQFWFGVQHPF